MTEYKKLILTLLKEYGKISVKRGRGTAFDWLYIHTTKKVPQEKQEETEKELVAKKYCGTYLSDQPNITSRDAKVIWSNDYK